MLFSKLSKLCKNFVNHSSNGCKYKILVQNFDEISYQPYFELGRIGSKKVIIKTVQQLAIDKNLLRQLGSEDAYLIGFITAAEQVKREQQEMQCLKNPGSADSPLGIYTSS